MTVSSLKTKIKFHKITLIFIGLLLIGALLRAWQCNHYSLWVDEAISSNASVSWVKLGQPYYYVGSQNLYFREPLHTLAIATSFKLFGISEATARLPFILSGILSLVATYLLAKKITNNKYVWLISMASMTFSIWAISWSHTARMYELVRMFATFFFYFNYSFLLSKTKKETWIYLLLSVLFSFGSFFSHRSAALLFAVLLLTIAFKYRKNILSYKKTALFIVLILILTGILILIFGQNYLPFEPKDLLVFSNLNLSLTPWKLILTAIPLWFGGFWYIGLKGNLDHNQKYFFWLTVGIIVVIDLLIYGTVPGYRNRYFQFVLPLVYIFGTLGFVTLWQEYGKKKIAVIILTILFILSIKSFTLDNAVTYEGIPDIKGVHDSLKIKKDMLLIATPAETAQFYFGKVDYWLITHAGEIEKYSDDNINVYSGATVLNSLDQLKNIVSTKHGYIIIENGRFRFIDKKILIWLDEHTIQKDPQDIWQNITVWQF